MASVDYRLTLFIIHVCIHTHTAPHDLYLVAAAHMCHLLFPTIFVVVVGWEGWKIAYDSEA
jgi:hypothetical protein